jgi:hypothetical protein
MFPTSPTDTRKKRAQDAGVQAFGEDLSCTEGLPSAKPSGKVREEEGLHPARSIPVANTRPNVFPFLYSICMDTSHFSMNELD